MTRRIPLRYCRKCPHYNGLICLLNDLHPCKKIKQIEADEDVVRLVAIAVACLLTLLGAFIFSGCGRKPEPQFIPKWSAVELLRQQHKDELTEWDMLQMAIIFTESRFNPDATGAANDAGLYQMTPVYVEEVNRISRNTYTHADAYDPELAVEMFAAMQEHYNPGHDAATALYYHNKSRAYASRVAENLELIRRYEAARAIIIKSHE